MKNINIATTTQQMMMFIRFWTVAVLSFSLLFVNANTEWYDPSNFGEMVIVFGDYQEYLVPPFSFSINNLNKVKDGSNRLTAYTTGSLPLVTGRIRIAVEAANKESDWSIDSSHRITINTPATHVHSWAEGWGVNRGDIGPSQLLVFKFNISPVNLPANTGLRITKLNVGNNNGEEVNPRYIVEGQSDTKLGQGKGPWTLNTNLQGNVRIGLTDGPYHLRSMTLQTFPIGADPPVTETIRGSRPNVILYVGDDQSKFDYGTYGNPKVPTPTTSAFASESLVFEQAFTGQTVCAPSRSMLYTGLYPVRNGCFMNNYSVRPGVKTLPIYLKELGYKVILAGKSHVRPEEQFPWDIEWDGVSVDGKPRLGTPFDEIDNFLANPGPDPFCLVVGSAYPHGPYFFKTPYEPEDIELPPYLPEEERSVYTRYYASIAEKEAEFARLLKSVDDNGLRDDTVVMYTDDHGSAKFFTYARGMNVAFMVRWPSKIQPGRTSQLVSFADYVPTMIDLAGGTVPSSLDGKSMVPIWEGNREAVLHDHLYGVAHKQGVRYGRGVFPQRSVYDGRYHYIYNFNSQERIDREGITSYFQMEGAKLLDEYDEELLFDLENDPFELSNIADELGMEEIKTRLRLQLFTWMEEQSDFLGENAPVPFLKVGPAFRLDIPDERVGHYVPTGRIGTLKGRMVDAHLISAP